MRYSINEDRELILQEKSSAVMGVRIDGDEYRLSKVEMVIEDGMIAITNIDIHDEKECGNTKIFEISKFSKIEIRKKENSQQDPPQQIQNDEKMCVHREGVVSKLHTEECDEHNVTCELCGLTFEPLALDDQNHVKEVIKLIGDIIQTIKVMYYDISSTEIETCAKTLSLLDDVNKIYKKAKLNFQKYEKQCNLKPISSNNIFGNMISPISQNYNMQNDNSIPKSE